MPELTGQKNAYLCGKLHITKTVNHDDGVTPFIVPCPVALCGTMAKSMYYQVIQDLIVPDYEFYKPSDEEAALLSGWEAQHVAAGGLLMRPIGAAPTPEFAFDTYANMQLTCQQFAKMDRAFTAMLNAQDASGGTLFPTVMAGYASQMKDKVTADVAVLMPPETYAEILATVPIDDGVVGP